MTWHLNAYLLSVFSPLLPSVDYFISNVPCGTAFLYKFGWPGKESLLHFFSWGFVTFVYYGGLNVLRVFFGNL